MKKYSNYKDKTVLITGAFGGFGQKFIKNFLLSDAKVILTDLNAKPILEVFKEENIPASYEKNVLGVLPLDLTKENGPQELYNACNALGKVDTVIHNAGIAFIGYFEDVPIEKHMLVMKLNINVPMELTHLFLPDFKKRKSGQFVFISSVAGIVATSYGSSYSSAKFGLKSFAMALFGELKKSGVDISIVYPFFTNTKIMDYKPYGNPPVPTMPSIFLGDPEKVIGEAMAGINSKKLHIRPGFYSKFMFLMTKLYPVIADQMKPPVK